MGPHIKNGNIWEVDLEDKTVSGRIETVAAAWCNRNFCYRFKFGDEVRSVKTFDKVLENANFAIIHDKDFNINGFESFYSAQERYLVEDFVRKLKNEKYFND